MNWQNRSFHKSLRRAPLTARKSWPKVMVKTAAVVGALVLWGYLATWAYVLHWVRHP